MNLKPDHLAISAETLTAGVSFVENLLGVPLTRGGEHPQMGTHNQLLSLGPDFYLEVIAINPEAAAPDRARWFDLDNFTGAPRLTNWIARTGDMRASAENLPKGEWDVMNLQRGDLRWQMAVPVDGRLPFDGMFPALIKWQGTNHPARQLADRGCRLEKLLIIHPEGDQLQQVLGACMALKNITIQQGEEPRMVAEIGTPSGLKVLA